jgi:hypothetical protein
MDMITISRILLTSLVSFAVFSALAADVKKPKTRTSTKTVKPAASAEVKPLTDSEKVEWQKWEAYLNDMEASYAKYPVDMCGKEIPTHIDQSLVPSFVKAETDAKNYCEEFRTKLSTMCRNAVDLGNNNKEKINKLVSKITCKLAAKPDEVSFKIHNGELIAFIGPKSSNLSEALLAFLDATPE